MATSIRKPTTPVPPRIVPDETLLGALPGLGAVLTAREAEGTIAARVAAVAERCSPIVVIDDGSRDGTEHVARSAGARVLRFPAPAGRGVALRAGFRLARELGAIGALVPSEEPIAPGDRDALARAFRDAPEALLLGVGPGEAIAGWEWEAARLDAAGEAARPRPAFRPPRSSGLHGLVEEAFERLVKTRFAHPWGSPRIYPLQAVLRRPSWEDGSAVDIELLVLCADAGVPTVEVELEAAPERRSVTCKRPALRLLLRFSVLAARNGLQERLGMGGGYAPPTTSPLLLTVSAGTALLLGG
jgi:hypothetical protein